MNNRSTKILRIIARLNIGGPAIQAVYLTHALNRPEFNSLLACGRVEPHEGDMAYLARQQGLQPLIIPQLGRQIAPIDDIKTLWRLVRLICRFRPHIVHTHTAKAGTLGRLAVLFAKCLTAKGLKARTVHTFHGHVFEGYFHPLKSKAFVLIERLLAIFTDAIIVVSQRQRQDITRRYNIAHDRKTHVVPLGFDLGRLARSATAPSAVRRQLLPGTESFPDVFLIGIVGRLTPIKNHAMLLEAIARLQNTSQYSNLRWVIVGDGECRDALQKKAQQLKIEKVIRFAGWHKDMVPVYRALDLVVLTSINEGTPVTLIEAMAAAKPVVATAVGGVPDLMGPEVELLPDNLSMRRNGILIPNDDDAALAKAMAHVYTHYADCSRRAEIARQGILKDYSQDRLLNDIKALYQYLFSKG